MSIMIHSGVLLQPTAPFFSRYMFNCFSIYPYSFKFIHIQAFMCNDLIECKCLHACMYICKRTRLGMFAMCD